MKQEYTNLLSEIVEQMANSDHILIDDIPDIELYMDQVVKFMDEHLKKTKRYEDDKILTKTMINNYAKNKLLPPPVKKRYTKEHMLVLIFIYYFKSFLPLGDIESILNPMTDRFFNSEEKFRIQDIYKEIYTLGRDQTAETLRDIMDKFHTASHSFEDCPQESREFLQLFSFICMLSFDIYLKKSMIEKMIDALPDLPGGSSDKKSKK